MLLLPNDTFTYTSDALGTQSWLDHCISTEDGHNMLENMTVLYENIMSDHLLLAFGLNLEFAPDMNKSNTSPLSGRIKWDNLSPSVISKYQEKTEELINAVHIPTVALMCNDCNCTNEAHTYLIGKFYEDIVEPSTLQGKTL